MADVRVINGGGKLAEKLAKLSANAVPEINRVIATVTLLAQEAIVEKITTDIRPHSGLSRKRNPQETVTDLVDTGAYRQSWQISVEPGKGKLFTNNIYALKLEYGDENLKGFGVARATARKMRGVYVQKMQAKIKDLLK